MNDPTKPAAERLAELIHKRLVDHLSQYQAEVSAMSGYTLRGEVRLVIERLVDTEDPPLNRMEREQLIKDVLNRTLGPAPAGAPWWA
jgi:hypothetical protein